MSFTYSYNLFNVSSFNKTEVTFRQIFSLLFSLCEGNEKINSFHHMISRALLLIIKSAPMPRFEQLPTMSAVESYFTCSIYQKCNINKVNVNIHFY